MRHATRFIFGSYSIDATTSVVTFSYVTEFDDGTQITFTDQLWFGQTTTAEWSVAADTMRPAFESLSLILGGTYWKLHAAPVLNTEAFTLDHDQAQFWNDLYTKGFGEFFYRSHIDFRGLVSFPFSEHILAPTKPRPDAHGILLALGGGKDSIVVAEALKGVSVPFETLVLGNTAIQHNVARIVGKPLRSIIRTRDPRAAHITKQQNVQPGYPFVCAVILEAVTYAMLHGHRYIILANEGSADNGNLEYRGLTVNHQWSKSSECEAMMQRYITQYIRPDIIVFSPIRQLSEIEMVRRFAGYREYFNAFSSCNMNFFSPRSVLETARRGHAYWCNRCPKCLFMFACLAAFLPKEDVIDIFGKNLFADATFEPLLRRLLGLEGFKPFECVGTPDELIVAMHRVRESKSFANDFAMKLFEKAFPQNAEFFLNLERGVITPDASLTMPHAFTQFMKTPM